MYSQTTNFTTNNGFSGTFELINGKQVKQGSIVVEKFKTSAGEFSGIDLQEESVVFPWGCLDCSFEIAAMGNPVQVKNTTGKGFAHIIKAVRNHIKKTEENTVVTKLISSFKEKNTIEEQLKLVYRGYQLIRNIPRIDNLVAKVEKGMFLSGATISEPTDMPILNEQVTLNRNVDTSTKDSISEVLNKDVTAKTTTLESEAKKETKDFGFDSVEIANAEEEHSLDQSRYKSIKCVKTIEKLEQGLANAKATNDHLIINEVTRALEKQYKKCRF